MPTLTITRDATPDAFDFLAAHRPEDVTDEELAQFVEPSFEDIFPKVELIESDGEPMETDWHVRCMNLLLASISHHFKGRDDYYAGGNMFIYYSEEQARNRDYRGPDFFLVKGVNRLPLRPYWCVWQEGGKHPDVIIELTSPSTVKTDLTIKKQIYETIFSTRDYFCYDPSKQRVTGWRLTDGKYEPLAPDAHHRLWCDELKLWVGPWEGSIGGVPNIWLRFFTPDGAVVPIAEEYEASRANLAVADRDHADAVRREAVANQQQAEVERKQAVAKRKQAEVERKQAEAALAQAELEVARLKALLAEKGVTP